MSESEFENKFENEESSDTFQGFDTDIDKNHTSNDQKYSIENKKRKKNFLSQQEIENFNKNENLFKSNYFKLQIDELLHETELDSEDVKDIEHYISEIKNIIENIPEKEENDINSIMKEMEKLDICIPFPEQKPSKDSKYKFSYYKPTNISIVGSFPLRTLIKEEVNIDLAVQMPEKIFQKKDYMNYRYFYKRSYYLASLAVGIKKSRQFQGKMSFQLFNGDQLKPIIVISFIKDKKIINHKEKWNIFIIPSISQDVFQSHKLFCDKSCITLSNCPTPNYNFSILSDCTIYQHHIMQYSCLQSYSAFKDASILGKIWLKRRGFTSQKIGFGSFEWNMIIIYHLKHEENQFFRKYTSYHLFKMALQFLATRNLLEDPVYMDFKKDSVQLSKKKPYFFTFNGLNILEKLSDFDFQLIQLYASITLKSLNSYEDNFKSIFLEKVDIIPLQFDCYYSVPVPKNWIELSKEHLYEVSLKEKSFSLKLINIIKKALGNRIFQIVSITDSKNIIWDINSEFPSNTISDKIYIGILIDQENSQRIVERGPSPEDIDATKKFQEFWGKKSELRRFKDGSILESVVWDVKNKLWLVRDIMNFAVDNFIESNLSKTCHFFGPEYDKYIDFPKENWPVEFSQVRNAFDSLVKQIKSIENFQLQISSIMPSSDFSRYTASNFHFFLDSDLKKCYTKPCDIIIKFESSGKWPDDLKAIQKTKLAFLIKLSEELYSQKSIISKVGLENVDSMCLNTGFLDIRYENFIFRLRIHHDREKTLLQKELKDNSSQYRRDVLKKGLKLYDETYIWKPSHTLIFQNLCYKFKALSLSIRLTKKWFHSHLLSFHVPEILIELIVAKVFINSAPWTPPATANTGFLRCLSMLASWDWRSSPLIVDLSENLSSETYKIIENDFSTFRKQDPGINSGAMYIACNYKDDYYTWIWNKPNRAISGRITMLAKKSLHILALMNKKEIYKAFLPSLNDFDFIIYLNKISEITENSKIFEQTIFPKPDIIDMFIKQLEDIYNDSFIFFYNRLEKSIIAGVINPYILSPKSWRVNLGFSSMLLQDKKNNENVVCANILSMLGEIERLGGNLVKKIDIKNLDCINNIK
ncbi:hypothetical protein PORY_002026 [Pneumocystis oryctolagi]|uniref:Uncharacterized protein n=1 Tax=Pneumocystis oryctolagi TaxID=42067 RepID=A0ACB7CAP6_9ASCO|nr:hypothetical protein PORY_002026 [Pneumocystis oryctolagi]